MLANQVLQKTINEMKSITSAEVSIWSMHGKCLGSTYEVSVAENNRISDYINIAEDVDSQKDGNTAMFTIQEDRIPSYILVLIGLQRDCDIIGKLCVSQIENLIVAYKERLDKNHFIQNLLLDNFLLVDIYNKSKRLNIAFESRRVVYVIEPKKEEDSIVMETLKGLCATSLKDFITAIDENHIIFVKSLEHTDNQKIILHTAHMIADTLSAEAMVNVRVAFGNVVNELKDVSQSYKEAMMALDVGRIFYADKNVLAYGELGIGRLIHQLPAALCDMFLKEVLDGKALDQFDEETLITVYKFFENNLNVSETSRQLYIHRNTLVYRLEKIQKITGLDVRVFSDAMTFKIALMVASHMEFLKS
ncbi:MAG: helix-turn-helix domain-containing protein [Lachnospiraceae bacterium]|nr:helix-turn-helix domain-containing protein [Lachnospiraceae bacterium]